MTQDHGGQPTRKDSGPMTPVVPSAPERPQKQMALSFYRDSISASSLPIRVWENYKVSLNLDFFTLKSGDNNICYSHARGSCEIRMSCASVLRSPSTDVSYWREQRRPLHAAEEFLASVCSWLFGYMPPSLKTKHRDSQIIDSFWFWFINK